MTDHKRYHDVDVVYCSKDNEGTYSCRVHEFGGHRGIDDVHDIEVDWTEIETGFMNDNHIDMKFGRGTGTVEYQDGSLSITSNK